MQNETPKIDDGATLPDISETERLVQEVRHLLTHSESTLDAEGVKLQAETLERWLESYRRGLSAAENLSKNSDSFLNEMRERLNLALQEMQRLDDEGSGTPASKEQKQRIDEISRAIRYIDHLSGSMGETSFTPDESKP